jgi:hypothetical protein
VVNFKLWALTLVNNEGYFAFDKLLEKKRLRIKERGESKEGKMSNFMFRQQEILG